jgi:hypothetical protein
MTRAVRRVSFLRPSLALMPESLRVSWRLLVDILMPGARPRSRVVTRAMRSVQRRTGVSMRRVARSGRASEP